MKHRKYPSYEAAKAYIESIGKVTFKGTEGDKQIFTLEMPGRPYYILFLHLDGLLELWQEIVKPR